MDSRLRRACPFENGGMTEVKTVQFLTGPIYDSPFHFKNPVYGIARIRHWVEVLLILSPSLKELVFNSKTIKDLTNGLMDNVFNGLGAMIKSGYWR